MTLSGRQEPVVVTHGQRGGCGPAHRLWQLLNRATCVARNNPVDRKVKDDLIRALIHCLDQMTARPGQRQLLHMITEALDRVRADRHGEGFYAEIRPGTLRIQPTLMDGDGDDPCGRRKSSGPVPSDFDSVDEAFSSLRPPIPGLLPVQQRQAVSAAPEEVSLARVHQRYNSTWRQPLGFGAWRQRMGQYHGRRS